MAKDSEKNPHGYDLRKILVTEYDPGSVDPGFAQLGNVTLVLPSTADVEALVRERNVAAKEEVDRVNTALAMQAHEKEHGRKRDLGSDKIALVANNNRVGTGTTIDVDKERAQLEDNHFEGLKLQQNGQTDHVQIMDWKEPLKLIEQTETRTPDKEARTRDQALYKQLRERGSFRKVASNWELVRSIDELEQIRKMHPNYAAVAEFVRGQLLLAVQLKQPMRIPPFLLSGPPGVGKTHFSFALAEVLKRTMHRHSFDASHTAGSLMGSDRHWANTSTGLVFEKVCLSNRADPVILLDEVDKAVRSTSQSKPLEPLHSLLEPVSAKAVTDISAGITFDASYITWIATCNDSWRLPLPIVSRFRVFEIQPPTASEALDLARSIAACVHERFGAFDPPGQRIVVQIAHLTAREQIQVLEESYGRALVCGRKEIKMQDLPQDLRPETHPSDDTPTRLH